MNTRELLAAAASFLLPIAAWAASDAFHAPDSIVLKSGQTVRGMILKNSFDSVLMQEEFGEKAYPKNDIVRIRDASDLATAFTDIARKGDLPSWRVIANDLRTHDNVRSMVQIPATAVDNGTFQNVPYLSFRVNDHVEMNVYGDPNDPAGIEFGLYGPRRTDRKLQHTLRAYLAGFLTSRDEVRALYALDFKGGSKKAGAVTFEITPPNAPDAYGAWWISLYNSNSLNEVRLSDSEYAKLTKPVDEVEDRQGHLLNHEWTAKDLAKSERLESLDDPSVLLRGFYRDKKGDFRLVTEKTSE